MRTPIIETERLILRPLCIEDAQEVFDGWECDPDAARYMFWTSHNDINKTKEWLNFEVSKKIPMIGIDGDLYLGNRGN